NFYQLRAEIAHRGHYYHEYCMVISVERDGPVWQDMTADAEDAVIEVLRDLARWLYRQVEREYDCLSSDKAVDETILANDYTFTEAGRRFG
ncbi:antitoxin of toxin-antitoxin stability system, partial [Paracoccus sp. PXZ]